MFIFFEQNLILLNTSCLFIINIYIFFRPNNNAAVSSKTPSTRKQKNKVCSNKSNLMEINMDVQKSSLFFFHNTLNFPLSTEFKM